MDALTALILAYLIFFGWIPILAIGSVITNIIKANRCNKCTCNNCKKDEE